MSRPRIAAALEDAVRCPLTLVVAPAGWGKTAAVQTWLEEASLPHAWLGVEPDDDVDGMLWRHLPAALAACDAIPGDSPLRGLRPAPTGADRGFVRMLVNGLARLPLPIVVVLDDIHHIEDPAALGHLEFLVSHAPETTRFVLVSRRDPPLALQRMRAAGEVAELRAADLAFDEHETEALLSAHGVDLGADARSVLRRRTEGWAVGLRLAAFSLSRKAEPETFVRGFAGDDRAIADYLAEEVLAGQPDALRDFLLRTAIVDRVCGELAEALTGVDGGRRLLMELERANGFIAALDAHRRWFRYHPLLAEMLRAELALTAAAEVPELHRRAARWYAAHDHVREALHHAAAAEDDELVASLLRRHWLPLFLDGHGAVAARALDHVAGERRLEDPELAVAHAVVLLGRGSWPAADEHLGRAAAGADGVPAERRARFEQGLGVARLHRARVRGSVGLAMAEGRALLEQASTADDPSLAAVALVNVGVGQLWTEGPGPAVPVLEAGLSAARRAGREMLAITALGALSAAHLSAGRLRRTMRTAEEAVELGTRRGWGELPLVAIAYGTLANRAYLLDDRDAARNWRDHAHRALDSGSDPIALAALLMLDHLGAMADGDYDVALAAVRRGRHELARWSDPSWLFPALVRAELQALLALDDLAGAEALLASVPARVGESGTVQHVIALLRLAQGRPDAALDAIEAAGEAPAFGAPFHAIERAMAAARVHERRGDIPGSLAAVERALALAEDERPIRLILAHGSAARRLLERVQRTTAHRALVDELLARLAGRPPTPVETLPVPLTERELEVLRYLPTLRSVQDIARELYVSPNTVRTHIKSIYRKLEVGQRRDAVERARELHLIGGAAR